MLGGDVGRPAGDYRYMTPEGQLKVGDYQGADYTDPRRPMDATIRLQLIKGSKMSRHYNVHVLQATSEKQHHK